MVPDRRRALDAATRFKRAVSVLYQQYQEAPNESGRWLVGYEAEQLLWHVLFNADMLAGLLNTDIETGADFDDLERFCLEILNVLRERKGTADRESLIARLENVDGRTPAEAESFLAKAQELRAALPAAS